MQKIIKEDATMIVQRFTIARNSFIVKVHDSLDAWSVLLRRFGPFAAEAGADPLLTVDIAAGEWQCSECEMIYEPEFDGVGFISSRALRSRDGSLVVEFSLVTEGRPRMWMTMPPEADRAEIVIQTNNVDEDLYFLTHALMLAYMMRFSSNGTLLTHASAVSYGGRAYLFQGKSGTGKSTHSRLWVNNIAGAELLNDDHPIVRFDNAGIAMAYGSPWSGKTHCYRNEELPLGGFVRIVRGECNEFKRLKGLQAYASITASTFFLPFMTDKQRDVRHSTLERLAAEVPCCEMRCRPDANAALTCLRGLTNCYNER